MRSTMNMTKYRNWQQSGIAFSRLYRALRPVKVYNCLNIEDSDDTRNPTETVGLSRSTAGFCRVGVL